MRVRQPVCRRQPQAYSSMPGRVKTDSTATNCDVNNKLVHDLQQIHHEHNFTRASQFIMIRQTQRYIGDRYLDFETS